MAAKCPVKGCNNDKASGHAICWKHLTQAYMQAAGMIPKKKDKEIKQ